MPYEQPELPNWIVQLQIDVETYKAALMQIAQAPRVSGKCPYCNATTTPIGMSGKHVKITPHDENCPVKIAEKALL